MPEFENQDFQVIYDAGRKAIREIPRSPETGHDAAVVMPNSHQLVTLPVRKGTKPEFLCAKPVFNELAGFIEYVNAFKMPSTRLWFDHRRRTILAIIDYHKTDSDPMHGDHQVKFEAVHSDEWNEWIKQDKTAMTQLEFAEWIEDHHEDIVDPDTETMLKIATSLHAKKDATFKGGMDLTTGSTNFTYEEEIKGTTQAGSLEIPKEFQLGLRPFDGCKRFRVDARFRYRLPGGALRLHYKLIGPNNIIQQVFDKFIEEVIEKIGITPAAGNP